MADHFTESLLRVASVAWRQREWYVVTEFERTPSVNFRRAVELSQTHPGHTTLMDERNILIYRNIYRKEDLLQFQTLLKLIKNWKGTKLYLNGERVEAEHLGSGLQCFAQTVLSAGTTSERPEQCQMFWRDAAMVSGYIGCRRSHVSMEWHGEFSTDLPIWFAFGYLDKNQVYQLRQENLESGVMSELLEYHYCPLLHLDRIQTFLKTFPKRIDPRKDREWRYARRQTERSAPVVTSPKFDQRAAREAAILPVSSEAYTSYLRRAGILNSSSQT